MLVKFCIARHDNSKNSLFFNSLEATVTNIVVIFNRGAFSRHCRNAHFYMLKANFQIALHVVRFSMSACNSTQSLTDFYYAKNLASSANRESVLELETTFGNV